MSDAGLSLFLCRNAFLKKFNILYVSATRCLTLLPLPSDVAVVGEGGYGSWVSSICGKGAGYEAASTTGYVRVPL